MRDLTYYFGNPFRRVSISIAEHAAFSTDHLGRLTEIPHGQLNHLIAPTSAVIEAFVESVADDASKGALRMMRKAMKRNFKRTVSSQVEFTMGGVRRALRAANRPAEEELLYLPKGLAPFNSATDDLMGPELTRFADALADNETIVGAELVAEGAALLAAWQDIHANSESSTGQKANTEAERRAARDALVVQLYANLLTLAMVFPEQPDKLGLYMQQHLLGEPPSGGGNSGGGTTPPRQSSASAKSNSSWTSPSSPPPSSSSPSASPSPSSSSPSASSPSSSSPSAMPSSSSGSPLP
ncbi:MAG: hypothetical protein KDM63_14545 [Verrucomicrobiae bacterium]|nr:hypothetical protein [Verrucomicrobiae bacterium]